MTPSFSFLLIIITLTASSSSSLVTVHVPLESNTVLFQTDFPPSPAHFTVDFFVKILYKPRMYAKY